MRLSSIFKFSLLALPTLLLNEAFAITHYTPATLDSSPDGFASSVDHLFLAANDSFHVNYRMYSLSTKMRDYIQNAEGLLEQICGKFANLDKCRSSVEKYLESCKQQNCFALDTERSSSLGIAIPLLDRYQVATAFYIFRHCGMYERSYFKRRFIKLFKKEGKGYSSYKILIYGIMYATKLFTDGDTIPTIVFSYYINSATMLYATLIYRDAKLAKILSIVDKMNLLLLKFKNNLKGLIRGLLAEDYSPFCQETFESLLEGYGDYLAGFDSSLTPLATRFSAVTAKAFADVVYKTGTCPLRDYKQDLSRAGTALRDAGIRAGNALRNAGATISKRTTGALRGIHRRLTEASDKIRNRFRSRNGNGDDGSSDGLLDEDATGEATNDVKPEDDSTGDNEPKEDEITRL
ncbi:Rhoptry-associated protein 1 [Babesia duncani]|uniref:Rhoptry-associated protein 1 n=1 Tax=Babesia duncani TaxID=323732 RepID=A0AAD9PJ20_9APIC|nr:Rhoptry-associated protein 1 [Babesia duncani]